MSIHDEPYANGFGIVVGLVILWVGTLALFFAARSLFVPGGGGTNVPATTNALESRAPAAARPPIAVASLLRGAGLVVPDDARPPPLA